MVDSERLKELLASPLEVELRYVRGGGLTDKVSLFNKQADEHVAAQNLNPFSGAGGTSRAPIDKNSADYGRPVAGSKTDLRGKKAMSHISKEILELCEVIHESGIPIPHDKKYKYISFGLLFNIYTNISSKVVGILLRARKHGFVTFEGEVLFQRRDDDEPILLLKTIEEIRQIFSTGHALDHGNSSYAKVGGQ